MALKKGLILTVISLTVSDNIFTTPISWTAMTYFDLSLGATMCLDNALSYSLLILKGILGGTGFL